MNELRSALDLATDEELQSLSDILFRPKFNPIDYFWADPAAVQCADRREWIDRIEARFRFLAADGLTVLQRRSDRLSYRQILVQICRYLKISFVPTLSTADLEAELFLALLEKTWQQLPPKQQQILRGKTRQAIDQSPQFHQLPRSLQQDPLSLLVTGSSALAVTSVVRPWLMQQIAQQFVLHLTRYQLAKQALLKGGTAAAFQLQNRAALQLASRGMALNAARYGAVRGLFACLGPALWTYFLVDLGWRAIATNYGRIIPVVFTLAQIRLTRADLAAAV
ncbi:YaaW family protein [Almyronema epifaneia]|uniref:YaaW family protein n=1 Tax=Almyronema epifaneia S1 TaxID=2991925 RepID=A0ABW6IBI6_9CYAN